jgi:rhodanese-related sulfurtransferase
LTAAVVAGATVLDVRPAPDFVRGHAAGSLFVDFDRRVFLPFVRLLVPSAAAIVLVAADQDVAGAASTLLAGEGYRVTDTVVAGTGAPASLGPVEPLPTVGVAELADRLASPARDFQLVDVRQSFEWKLGYIKGAVLVPLKRLPVDAERWTPADEILLLCEQGVRSATAASYLRRRGYTNAKSVEGGVAAWVSSGRPLVED